MTLKFIKFRGDIINISLVHDVAYKEEDYKGHTKVDYGVANGHIWYEGNCVDEIWTLIKLAMKSKENNDEHD